MTSRTGRWPSSTSSVIRSPWTTPSTPASVADSTTPDGGSRTGWPLRSTMRLKSRRRRHAGDREVALAVVRRGCASRTIRCGSTASTPGSRASAWIARRAARLDEVDRHVLPFGVRELRQDQPVDGVAEDEADHQDRHRERDAEHRRRRAQRMAHHVAQDHAVRRCPAAWRRTGVSRKVAAVACRRFRPHRFGRRHAHGPAHRAERAGARRDERQRRRADDHPERHAEQQHGKAEEVVVERDDDRAEPGAQPRLRGRRRAAR